MNRTRTKVLAGAVALLAILPACGSSSGSSASGDKAKTATSVDDFGGMDGLVAAAKKEGTLNVITLPPDWANYGAIIKQFETKYGIKVVSQNPDGSSQDEITAVTKLKGQSRAPDVLDLGNSFALTAATSGLLAPYKVATWDQIPDTSKDADGKWFADYGGFVAIGYDSKTIKNPPTSFADLLKPEYKNQVAINGDPTSAGAAFAAVYAASLANGGSFDDIPPGIDFFGKLKDAGNFVPVEGNQATVQSGQTPILVWWDYLQASSVGSKVPTWKVIIPSDGHYAAYYDQAINATAPHPAAARLWEEFLYSTEGQNMWLQGKARPIELASLQTAGTEDKTAFAALPEAPSDELKFPTADQLTKAQAALTAGWSKAVGG